MPEEPISIKKAVGGLIEPKNTIKATVFAFHIGLVFVFILGAVKLFDWVFPKKPTQSQEQISSVVFSKGSGVSSVIVNNEQKQKIEISRKTVGLEVSASSKDVGLGFVKYLGDNDAVVLGVRWGYKKDENGESQFMPEIRYRHDF